MAQFCNTPTFSLWFGWFRALFLMSTSKKRFSAKEMQRQLNLKRYEPVWTRAHKISEAMAGKVDPYTLEGIIETDKGYFRVASCEIEQVRQKRGREVAEKQNLKVSSEGRSIEDPDTGKESMQVGYLKADVLNSHQAEQTNQTVCESFDEKSIELADKSASYVEISSYELYVGEKSDWYAPKETLKWVLTFISNAKRDLQGTYHRIKVKYFQLYLSEFVYRRHGRNFGDKLFDRVIVVSYRL